MPAIFHILNLQEGNRDMDISVIFMYDPHVHSPMSQAKCQIFKVKVFLYHLSENFKLYNLDYRGAIHLRPILPTSMWVVTSNVMTSVM